AESLEQDSGVEYAGLDFSLAPFPADDVSVGACIEALGVDCFGAPGTLAAVAALTSAIRAARLRRVGFCGVMRPVLEDWALARRVTEGRVSLSELLLSSTVCGTGLDTVPLPGDIGEDEIQGILAEVGALSIALDKPLTARLFPVPGRAAGEMTE